MIKKWIITGLALIFISPVVLPEKKRSETAKLPEKYRKWMEEEVVYIITPVEKKIFLMLQNDRERDIFIEAFWKNRNPDPNAPENEFKKEHYRRIEYANNWFGKDSPGPGWRTDMGKTYITLGPPKDIQRYENETEVYPTIIWYYQGMGSMGLPDAFTVVFFKRGGIGEYEYYSPVKFGPQYLMPNYKGAIEDYATAYQELMNIRSEIAAVSLTLIPGEPIGLSPSMASEILISSKIPAAPQFKVNSIYAEKFLKYKEIVSLDYSANYITSESLIQLVQDKNGNFFIHYLVEPKTLSIEFSQQKYYTTLEISGNLTDDQNTLVYQFNKTIPIEMNDKQIASVRNKLFSFQDMIPVISGKYHFNLLIKNTISKEFTSVEKVIRVPEKNTFGISPLLLANRQRETTEPQSAFKPFQFANSYLVPSPRHDFTQSETLYVFFQVFGLTPQLRTQGTLRYSILRNTESVLQVDKKASEYESGLYFIEKFPLAELPPANYSLVITLLNQDGKPLLNSEQYFYISPFGVIPRPWVLWSPPRSENEEAYLLQQIGDQYLNRHDLAQANDCLEKAWEKSPKNVAIALDFTRLLLELKEYQRVKEIGKPFLAAEIFELAYPLGQACQALGEYREAVDCYIKYLSHFGSMFHVFNDLADCYLALNDKANGLRALEKSLEINPGQEVVRSRVERLKGEINEKK